MNIPDNVLQEMFRLYRDERYSIAALSLEFKIPTSQIFKAFKGSGESLRTPHSNPMKGHKVSAANLLARRLGVIRRKARLNPMEPS